MLKATSIIWDMEDAVDAYNEGMANLPTEVELPSDMEDIDEIADYLSDEYGFCVVSFQVDEYADSRCPICDGHMIIHSKNGLCRCLECGNEIE